MSLLLIVPFLLIGQPPEEDIILAEAEVPPPHLIETLPEKDRAKIKDVFYDTEVKMIELRSKIDLKRLDLRKELHSEKPDLAKIKRMINELADLKAQARILKVESMLKIRDIVGPEKWEKLRKERHKHRPRPPKHRWMR